MSDFEFEKETDMALAIVRRPHGPGGELPGKACTFIPEDRAERALALDERIETVRKVSPLICGGAASLLIICAASLGWIAPGLAAVAVLTCILQSMGRYRKGF